MAVANWDAYPDAPTRVSAAVSLKLNGMDLSVENTQLE